MLCLSRTAWSGWCWRNVPRAAGAERSRAAPLPGERRGVALNAPRPAGAPSASPWPLRVSALLVALAGAAAHAAVAQWRHAAFDRVVISADAALVVLVLALIWTHSGGLARERRRQAMVRALIAALAAPRGIEETAAAAVRLCARLEIADAAMFAVVRDGSDDAADVELVPIASAGYGTGWELTAERRPLPAQMPHAPHVARVASTDSWLAAAQGRIGARPWVAQVPLVHREDVLGVLVLSARTHDVLRDHGLLVTIGQLFGTALGHAQLHRVAYDESRGLAEQDARRREFLYAIAHELRTPLSSIAVFADLLQEEPEVANAGTGALLLVDSLASGVERLGALVNELLDLGRVEEADLSVQLTGIDLGRAVQAAELLLRPAFLGRQQAVGIDAPSRGLLVLADQRALEQVLLNLLSNANRFTPEGGAITIRARAIDRRVRLEVEDSGPGIAVEDRERIFNPFYRVTREGAPAVPGSGLGLAVARRMVELQGGVIWVEAAAEGYGSRFCVELPLLPPDGVAPDAPVTATYGVPGANTGAQSAAGEDVDGVR